MSYTPTNWVDGETPVNAENLNKLEQGMADIHAAKENGELDGQPGTPGTDGKDGVSPVVSVSDITGGHRVTITDANGAKTFDVMDGKDGVGGGGAGVHIGTEAPTDENVTLWLDTDEEPEAGGLGGSDWNAAEGEPGHILNRPFCSEISRTEKPIQIVYEPASGGNNSAYYITEDLGLTAGNTYTFKYVEKEYNLVAQDISDIINTSMTGVFVGNKVVVNGEDDGIPFGMLLLSEPDGIIWGQFTPIGSGVSDISLIIVNEVIHKLPQKFVHNADLNAKEGEPGHVLNRQFYSEYEISTVLAETSPAFDEDAGQFVLTDPITVVTGNEYTVNWNGTKYTCVCGEFDIGEGVILPVLGNLGAMGIGDDTGEPFLIAVAPAEEAAETGFTAMFQPLDGSTELTISITGMVETVHKIPSKFYDTGTFFVDVFKYEYEDAPSNYYGTTSVTYGQVKMALEKGQQIVARLFGTDGMVKFDSSPNIGVFINGLWNPVGVTFSERNLTLTVPDTANPTDDMVYEVDI